MMSPSLVEKQILPIEVRPNLHHIVHQPVALVLTSPRLGDSHLSTNKIPSSVDASLDRQIPTNGRVLPGVSMVNGVMKKQDRDTTMVDAGSSLANGVAKRKAQLARPDYADAESSDDDLPLVRVFPLLPQVSLLTNCAIEQETKNSCSQCRRRVRF